MIACVDQNKLNIKDNLSRWKQVEFKIICMDQHNLKTSDNFYGSEQVEYLR